MHHFTKMDEILAKDKMSSRIDGGPMGVCRHISHGQLKIHHLQAQKQNVSWGSAMQNSPLSTGLFMGVVIGGDTLGSINFSHCIGRLVCVTRALHNVSIRK